MRAQALAVALLVAAAVGCGSSGDGSGDAEQDTDEAQSQDTAEGDAADDGSTADGGDSGDDGDDGSAGDSGDDDGGDDASGGDGGDGEQTDATPAQVGTVVAGRAVATVSGTSDVREEQSGDVTHVNGEDCRGDDSLAGLEAGATVTILDATSGEVVGSGQIESASGTEISDGSDGNLPVWECAFAIRATISTTPGAIRVQVADLPPFDVTGSINDFEFAVTGSDTSPPTDTSAPTDTTPPTGTVPPTGTAGPFVDTTPPFPVDTPPPSGVVTIPST